MRVAVLIGEIVFDSQRRIVDGILGKAREKNGQVYLFVGDAEDYQPNNKYENGEYNIYKLPDFSAFDGVIFVPDTIHNAETVKVVTERIRASGVPCVSINVHIDGFMFVEMGNENGMKNIVEHLFNRHGVRELFYISGPNGNNDAAERRDSVARTCWRYQIPFNERTYECGNYTNMSGYNVVDRYLSEHTGLPDAFVAANDLMAFGAITRLKEAGYDVPGDVIVTGYDNSAFATIHLPGLTTVERGETECGATAFDLLEGYVKHGILQECVTIEGSTVFRGSCGCNDTNDVDPVQLSNMYVTRGLRQNNKHHFMKLLMAEATGMHNYDDFLNGAKAFIPIINPKEMYICIKGDRKEYQLELNNVAENIPYGRDISDYMDNTSVEVAWKDGRFLPPRMIATADLIPKDYTRDDRYNVYMFQPLHHQERCFGYAVYANDEDMIMNDPFVSMFSLIISNALETVLRQDTMRTIMGKLDKLSTTDGLTGVMTRAGVREKWPEMQIKTEKQGMLTGVIFADLDGLKKVNDKYGHEEGDRYIVMVAEAMKALPIRDGFVYRYGGDELVAVCSVKSEDEIKEYIGQIHAAVDDCNRKNPIAYTSRVSLGWCVSTGRDLEEMIRIADKNMYMDKHKSRN